MLDNIARRMARHDMVNGDIVTGRLQLSRLTNICSKKKILAAGGGGYKTSAEKYYQRLEVERAGVEGHHESIRDSFR
jgi:hypothetical protein